MPAPSTPDSMSPQPSTPDSAPSTPYPRRWWALAVIAGAQLVLMLDAVVVNIALPSAQAELGLSDGDRQWVVTAYTLAFGGLLLLGGRLGDLVGRKRTFTVGLLGFAAASAFGGAATTPAMLLAGRALQGVFAAVLAPTVMSLIVLIFTDVRERAKSFGMYGILGAAGSSVGLVLGGLLTQFLDWRSTMYVNVPVAIAAAFAGARILPRVPATSGVRLDVPGTVLGTTAIATLVFAFARAEADGWGSVRVLVCFAVAAVALAAFVLRQARVRQPLVPLRILADRTRAGALATILLMVAGNYGQFLFTTYYMQDVLHYGPLVTGVAYIPMTGAMVVTSMLIVPRLPARLPVTAVIGAGLAVAVTGLLLFSRIEPHGSYASQLLAPMMLQGAGMGLVFGRIMGLPTSGVHPQEAGAASALTNVSQQVGGSIGPALLNTIALSATSAYAAAHPGAEPAAATTHGLGTGFAWSAGLLGLAFAANALLVRDPRTAKAAPEPQRAEAAAVN